MACQRLEIPDNTTATEDGKADESLVEHSINAMSHVILYADTVSEEKVDVMYISLLEWSGMASSFSSEDETEACRIASEYTEGGLGGWHIPTLGEVQCIKAYYDEKTERLTALNRELELNSGHLVYLTDATDKTYRYLCSEGDSTFSFRQGYATLKAGATVKYHLRLVKDSVITLVPHEIEFDY